MINADFIASRGIFEDFRHRIALSKSGIFSVDRTEHRNRREAQALAAATLDTAYRTLGLDRRREHGMIAGAMEATMTSGIWARSTGEYSKRCHARDREALRAVWLGEK